MRRLGSRLRQLVDSRTRRHEQMLFRADRCYLTADASPLTRGYRRTRRRRRVAADASVDCVAIATPVHR